MENNVVDWKRIGIFIAFAFGIAWLVALGLYLTGGLTPTPITLVALAVGYMGAPALAHILTRLITREGWQGHYLRPNFKKGWLYWLICWVSPVIFAYLGMVIFFTLFPQYYDPTFSAVTKLMEQSATAAGQTLPAIDPWIIVLSQTLTALLVAPILNAIPILGEEFGWRAYLQPKLIPLGGRKAMLLMGVVWGLWHAPLIAMGHNTAQNILAHHGRASLLRSGSCSFWAHSSAGQYCAAEVCGPRSSVTVPSMGSLASMCSLHRAVQT